MADLKIKTKSNIKNDRVVAAPPGAIGCATGDTAFTWATARSAPADGARNGRPAPDPAPDPAACANLQDTLAAINASNDALARLQAYVDRADAAGLRQMLADHGLSSDLIARAEFHAINTKGTGATRNGRARADGAIPGVVIAISVGYDARTRRGYSLANWMYFNVK